MRFLALTDELTRDGLSPVARGITTGPVVFLGSLVWRLQMVLTGTSTPFEMD